MNDFDTASPLRNRLGSVEQVVVQSPGVVPAEVFDSNVPIIIKGLVNEWPAVEAPDLESMERYLSGFWIDRPVVAYVGAPGISGRFFYDEHFTGFNFKGGSAPLAQIFDRLTEQESGEDRLAIYVGSTPVDTWLPGFRDANDIKIPAEEALVSFWLGNQTRISAHYDYPDNIACVVAGRRRFTLFPPEQVGNLYVGPIDKTPSGQAISLVDFSNPDLAQFPKFELAMEAGCEAVCEPGDAIYIPSLWWHHVESQSAFNMLVNYWWIPDVASRTSPATALLHAMLTVRDLPARHRAGWKTLFDHYVFDSGPGVYDHIPESARGPLAPLDDVSSRRLLADILNRLNQ
ncbi:cupin-like domain-containing protein [Luminiphilus sp.]|nr:cupin-like domain-containing protein [Luminiphilus sp.]